MRRNYADILQLVPLRPQWFDEHGVPRFCLFTPYELANIYADEACLLLIKCAVCDREFRAAVSTGPFDYARGTTWLSKDVREIHYGYPPNVACCTAGPTVASVSLAVLQFFVRREQEWARCSEYEIAF